MLCFFINMRSCMVLLFLNPLLIFSSGYFIFLFFDSYILSSHMIFIPCMIFTVFPLCLFCIVFFSSLLYCIVFFCPGRFNPPFNRFCHFFYLRHIIFDVLSIFAILYSRSSIIIFLYSTFKFALSF